MQDSDQYRKQVITNLRSCLISSQGGIPVNSVNYDYKQLVGEPIPFKKLGFNSLDTFLRSVPEISLKNVNGKTLVEAKETACSTHITKLVDKQRKSGRKRSRKTNNTPRLRSKLTPGSAKFSTSGKPHFRSNSESKTAPRQMKEIQTRNQKPSSMFYNPSKSPLLQQPSLPNFTSVSAQFTNSNVLAPSPQYPYTVLPTSAQIYFPPQSHPLPLIPPSRPVMSPLMRIFHPPPLMNQPALESAQQFPLQQPVPPSMSEEQLPIKKKLNTSTQKANNSANFKTTLPIPTNMNEDSYYYLLLDYAEELGWPQPEISLSQQKCGNIICTVSVKCSKPGERSYMSVGEQQFTTYPEEFRDPQKALEEGTKKAYLEISKNSSKSYAVITHDVDLILTRIAKMVEDKCNGVWAFQIEKDYLEKYKENLPPKWIDDVINSQTLTATDLGHSYVVRSFTDKTIGKQQFTTYPEEIRDPKKSLEENTKKTYFEISKNSLKSYAVTHDIDLILTRIAKMVEDKCNGVWAFQIEKDYLEKYKENLPQKWIDYVINSQTLTATDLGHSYVVRSFTDKAGCVGFFRVEQRGVVATLDFCPMPLGTPSINNIIRGTGMKFALDLKRELSEISISTQLGTSPGAECLVDNENSQSNRNLSGNNTNHCSKAPITFTKKRSSLDNSIISNPHNANKCKDDEFDLFGKSIAIQLRNMPLDRAVICQEKLLSVLREERLRQLNYNQLTNKQEIFDWKIYSRPVNNNSFTPPPSWSQGRPSLDNSDDEIIQSLQRVELEF